jgi:hypothetical protein
LTSPKRRSKRRAARRATPQAEKRAATGDRAEGRRHPVRTFRLLAFYACRRTFPPALQGPVPANLRVQPTGRSTKSSPTHQRKPGRSHSRHGPATLPHAEGFHGQTTPARPRATGTQSNCPPVDLWIRAGPILRPEAYSLPERKMVTIRIMVRITASVKPRKLIRDAPR